MKRNAISHRHCKKGKLSFRKGFVLFIIGMLLPGCMDNVPKCEINAIYYCINNTATFPFNNITANDWGREANDKAVEAADSESEYALKETNNETGKILTADIENTTPANDGQAPANHALPTQLIDTEHHFDPHDKREKENVITAKLPRLMRWMIALMLLVFIV